MNTPLTSLPTPGDITGLVLAGGLGSRMGGTDKGLQNFNGTPMALHALLRLHLQQGGWVGPTLLNANRNLAAYEAFGSPVWPDTLRDHAGPLAGFITGLAHCETPWLLTVPCDTPHFPLDLADRLVRALVREQADIAMAAGPENEHGPTRSQPVFCLMSTDLLTSLDAFTQAGGRKIERWTAQHHTVLVPFDQPGDNPRAFFNANTLADLQHLQAMSP
jgi:molybdopterin-guanine dinucleotide biosynthesis protein A